jgi:hypothetical protein
MEDPLRPLEAAPQRPSFLVRAAVYTLVPILVVAALPLLLLLILAIYLLALVQGGRVFVFRWSGTSQHADAENELPKLHFLEIQEPAKALPDESSKPTP